MTTTPRGAPELVSAQALPESTVNEQIRRTEGGAGRYPIADRVTAPPGSCADGAQYIIIATATGAFATKEGQIAQAVGTNAASGWNYRVLGTIDEGILAYVQDEDVDYKWSGSAWASVSSGTTYASTTEQLTGAETAKASNPDTVAALWEQGSDVASSGTISIGEGGYFNVTGTTTITDIDFATDKAGRKAWVKFAGILTLTHNASTLILPTGANITTAAGDTACFVSEGSDVIRCVAYNRASGAPLAGGGAGGFGDVVGPGSSTAGHVALFDGTTGKLLKDAASAIMANGAQITPAATPATNEVGYLGAPQNSQSTAYTTVMADAGKHIFHPSGDANARTFTIDSNANVAYPIGTILTFINMTSQVVTIAITSDTMYLAGTGTTGSRSLAQYGVATAVKMTSTTWLISGSGLT